MGRASVVMISLLGCLVAFSGCLDDSGTLDSTQGDGSLLLYDGCPSSMPECSIDAAGHLRIKDLRLQGENVNATALTIASLDTPWFTAVTIEDVVIVGFASGILLMTNCDCPITISNARLTAGNDRGFGILGSSGDVGPAAMDVTVVATAIRGFAWGVSASGGGLTLRDVYITETAGPVFALDLDAFEAEKLRMNGCDEFGLLFNDVPSMTISDSSFMACKTAVLAMSDKAGSSVSISGTRFESNYLGAMLRAERIAVSDSIFVKNAKGIGLGETGATTVLTIGPGQDDPHLVVRGTHFQGNDQVAIVGFTYVDARENWWGSATGPRVVIMGNAVGPPGGDAVTDGVDFVPFLTSPP